MIDTLVPPGQLADFVPLAERAVSVDAASLIRFRAAERAVAGFVRLPYDVLAGRTLAAEPTGGFDITVSAADFLQWVEQSGPVPAGRDAHWLSALPPRHGWRRVDVVPDSVVRNLVRSGAELAAGTTSRQGQESLLASVVLTAADGASPEVQVRLGALTALTRMGFLPRDGQAAIDTAPGWVRVAAAYGSTYTSDGNPLGLLSQ
ncbi:hypothetical protein [Jatrophihabitans sp.]|uniref:hypothetical protein n=1 Tax=Jatrophihabitans sp. TaxID=1932789 RepID=UPI002BDACF8F|nr:hypothetical protein [Jatrophihabitans sp.]